jgi:hypothetical protein
MLGTLLRLVGVDLQRQIANLRAQAEDFKDRTSHEVRRQVADAGITIGFAVLGLFFVLLTVVVGLAALYLWAETKYGPFAGLGMVGLATAILAAAMLAVVVARSHRAAPIGPRAAPFVPPPAAVRRYTPAAPYASLVDSVTSPLVDRTAAVTHEALDAAAEMVRKSPREAVLTTLAVAAVVGIFIGRRRRSG